MQALRHVIALGALLVLRAWNAAVAATLGRANDPRPYAVEEPELTEHERNWYDYVRGFDAHHGDADGDHPEHGSFRSGLDLWLESGCLRGYTLGNDTYVCPNAPRVLRVHQAGHAPAFGGRFEPLRTELRADGGLEDEPLYTFDVMLPGAFPHTLLRLRDPRGLGAAYDRWLEEGRIRRA